MIRGVLVLSLADCGFHIDRVITQVGLCGVRGFRSLNVSGNSCEHFQGASLSIPASLISLSANRVRWFDLCLSGLLRLLFFRRRAPASGRPSSNCCNRRTTKASYR